MRKINDQQEESTRLQESGGGGGGGPFACSVHVIEPC